MDHAFVRCLNEPRIVIYEDLKSDKRVVRSGLDGGGVRG
jgi:hypothetical protein